MRHVAEKLEQHCAGGETSRKYPDKWRLFRYTIFYMGGGCNFREGIREASILCFGRRGARAFLRPLVESDWWPHGILFRVKIEH